jgi:hypothetical protein
MTTVSSHGYSTCTSTAQQVERGLSVTYPDATVVNPADTGPSL